MEAYDHQLNRELVRGNSPDSVWSIMGALMQEDGVQVRAAAWAQGGELGSGAPRAAAVSGKSWVNN